LAGELQFAKVQFYFRANINNKEETLALISLYSEPDKILLEQSYGTIWSCNYQDMNNLRIVDVSSILSVVALIPRNREGNVFVAEKLGLDVAYLGDAIEGTADM
jgi:hypothetical protein